ncbi:DUF6173 family protein [Falsibacillus pallidus]|uniref:DUF6173 family protein n=1 Tax=Falsibacillus pallidus TaxID=493781 RepID=UPI003D99CF20
METIPSIKTERENALLQDESINPELASAFYRKIIDMILLFESQLNEEEEVGLRLVSFGNAMQFHVDAISYINPSLISFMGMLNDGSKVKLIQHVSQISFLLMALPKREEHAPPNRIGFLYSK